MQLKSFRPILNSIAAGILASDGRPRLAAGACHARAPARSRPASAGSAPRPRPAARRRRARSGPAARSATGALRDLESRTVTAVSRSHRAISRRACWRRFLPPLPIPTQIVEAERFLQQNPNLKGKELGDAVDQQDWDPSVKALTQFPSVLANLDKDLSWTSELGDANYNQQADLMQAVQVMRKKAEEAGHLKSTPQQTVTNQGPQVVIQPANPEVVYVPEYDPEYIYGYPVGIWPGFYPWWGVGGPYLSFGVGFGISPFFGYGWGWHGWGFDWYHRGLIYGGRPYAYHSRSFYDRNAYFHGNYRGYAPYGHGAPAARGFAASRPSRRLSCTRTRVSGTPPRLQRIQSRRRSARLLLPRTIQLWRRCSRRWWRSRRRRRTRWRWRQALTRSHSRILLNLNARRKGQKSL